MPSSKRNRPAVHIVGPGRLGAALAANLRQAGWDVASLVVRPGKRVSARSAQLARRVGARVVKLEEVPLAPGLVWITVPDDSIAVVAAELAARQSWKGRVVFHSSGALTSDVLEPLRAKGAKVASVHPVMTFAGLSAPNLRRVPFGLEGDASGLRLARRIVGELGGVPFLIRKEDKVLYHAFGAFASPLLIALLAALEEVGTAAGFEPRRLRTVAGPLLQQTLGNYLERGATVAFTGPFVRGDVAVIERHIEALRKAPLAREVYRALARVALKKLPVRNRNAVKKVVGRTK